MATLCNVTGTFRNRQGNPFASEAVTFRYIGSVVGAGDALVPETITTSSTALGAININLYPGYYTVYVSVSRGGQKVDVETARAFVPQETSADIADIIDQEGALTPTLVDEARDAAAAAEASASAAAASASSIDVDKLAGIEALADVTDTANVTAAGALMDSEVSSLSGIKTLTVPDNTTISAFGATLVDDADAVTARTTLGLATTDTPLFAGLTVSAATSTLNVVDTDNVGSAGGKIAFFGANRSDTDEEMAYIKASLSSNNGGSGNVQSGWLTVASNGGDLILSADANDTLAASSINLFVDGNQRADLNNAGYLRFDRDNGGYGICTMTSDNQLYIAGGQNALNDGVNLNISGSTHAAAAAGLLIRDNTTNIYAYNRSGDSHVWYTGGGIERTRISSNGDFSVDTNTLYVDATNNRVGINTTTPGSTLDVSGDTTLGGNLDIAGVKIETPVHHGAVIDGTTNDQTAIGDMVTAMKDNNGMGLFPAGSYNYGGTIYTLPHDYLLHLGDFTGGINPLVGARQQSMAVFAETGTAATMDAAETRIAIAASATARGGQHADAVRASLTNYSTDGQGNTGGYFSGTSYTGAFWTAALHGEVYHAAGTGIGTNVEVTGFSTSGALFGIVVHNGTGAAFSSGQTHSLTGASPAMPTDSAGISIHGSQQWLADGGWLTGIRFTTTSLHSTGTAIHIQDDAAYGVKADGAYSSAAYLMGAGEKFAMDSTATVHMTYSGGSIAFKNGTTVRGALAMGTGIFNVTGSYQVLGTQVVGARITGWGAPTGTATRTTFNTSTVTTAQLAERVHGLIDDLTTHGLIAA